MHCGLDFGTSNSTLGTAANGIPRLLPLEGGRVAMPSVIFFGFEDNHIHFGREALTEYVSGADGRVMRSLKSVLGTALIRDVTRVKAKVMPFIDILGLYIKALKRRGEAALDTELDTVVMGRPVQFVDGDPVADKEAQSQLEVAVRRQGFKHIDFQFEPIAAALDYERQVTSERLALIADLGGGTSDFTVIRVSPERARTVDRAGDILSTAGVHVGGTDLDRLLSMSAIMPLMGMGTMTADGKRHLPVAPYYDLSTWHRINRLYDQKTLLDLKRTRREAQRPDLVERLVAVVAERHGHNLLTMVEDAKIALSDQEIVPFRFETDETVTETSLTREELTAAIDSAVQKTGDTITETLQRAGVGARAIDSLILTGGSTQVPAIAAMLRARFPAAEIVHTDAFGSVGMGLALDASRRFGG